MQIAKRAATQLMSVFLLFGVIVVWYMAGELSDARIDSSWERSYKEYAIAGNPSYITVLINGHKYYLPVTRVDKGRLVIEYYNKRRKIASLTTLMGEPWVDVEFIIKNGEAQ